MSHKEEKKCTCGEPHISKRITHCYDGKPCYIISSPTTEEWEKDFYEMWGRPRFEIFTKKDWKDNGDTIMSFIRLEKEKSYKEGIEVEHKRFLNQKSNQHDQEIRSDTLEEVLREVEALKEENTITFVNQERLQDYINSKVKVCEDIISTLKEKLK